ncbi:MAG: lipopolysaccharide heptosyltransferase II [candidate division KSB1 bacterium]|nr:lipopolysaccharide heptosyltransferase II [candidate division KSB1 bacterium]MDZ7335309.1 lipopolysaccharide heptosyltransferase II [candidate division KSB1 bacterium]MDZ7357233.1 lipopolysaccharide heptosyltransferase II [candidate division KSB1 bacterium]MDZ7375141.1 lipopolysaccharide heptosyltransferase II [candidate division KSB1 bacterium]MDZ7399078.1 lipopolysaccharide heptosyltransferase II [candidate division KSB1 bacterium]
MVQNSVEIAIPHRHIYAPKSILVIRFSSIGDILLTTPVVRLLKTQFPDCQIDFVVKEEFAELLVKNPNIAQLYRYSKTNSNRSLKEIKQQIRAHRYDLIVDLHKNFRSYYLSFGSRAQRIVRYRKGVLRRWLLVQFKLFRDRPVIPIFQRYLNTLLPYQLSNELLQLEIFVPEQIVTRVEKQYGNFIRGSLGPIIGIASGAKHETKRWTAEGFNAVIRFFIEQQNARVILFGGATDVDFINQLQFSRGDHVLNVAGQLSLLETAALMAHCDLMLTNDSGLMHLATALRKKVVAIFGSTTEQLGFFPYLTEYLVVQNDMLSCRPCSHIGRKRCPKGHFKCMKDISADQVIAAMLKLLNEPVRTVKISQCLSQEKG